MVEDGGERIEEYEVGEINGEDSWCGVVGDVVLVVWSDVVFGLGR